MGRFTECATRKLKLARHLQRHHPDIVPPEEPAEGFASMLEGTDPMMRFQLREALDSARLPAVSSKLVAPCFSGTISVARLLVGPASKVVAVPAADAVVVLEYLGGAITAIQTYAGQYGTCRLSVEPTVLTAPVSVPSLRFNDTDVQNAVNALVAGGLLPAQGSAALLLNAPGALNTDADPSQGVLGYHGKARIPYSFVNLVGEGIRMDDRADQFALAVSHEIAEMTVDPEANLANPEVCDPCGPNCQTPIRDYFDSSGKYLASDAVFPPTFSYAFFVNAIVRPLYSTNCPAPVNACAYAP